MTDKLQYFTSMYQQTYRQWRLHTVQLMWSMC